MRLLSTPATLLFVVALEFVSGVEKSSLLSYNEPIRKNKPIRELVSAQASDSLATDTFSTRFAKLWQFLFREGTDENSVGDDFVEEDYADEFRTIRINCGASKGSFDGLGHWWQQDEYYSNGTTLNRQFLYIEGTDYPEVYQSQRRSESSPLTYAIPVPVGVYNLVLHFIEFVYQDTGERTFDVTVEDIAVPQAQDLDIIEEVGAINTPLEIRRRAVVSDGFLTISLLPIVANATIAGIEVVQIDNPATSEPVSTSSAPVDLSSQPIAAPAPPPPTSSPLATVAPVTPAVASVTPTPAPVSPTAPIPAPLTAPVATPTPVVTPVPAPTPVVTPVPAPTASFEPILINTGGGEYTDTYERQWSADRGFTGGTTYTKTFDILDTEDDYIYASERYGSFSYTFDLPVGNYEVIFHFAETFFNSTGQRVFTIKIQSQVVFENVDILVLTSGQQFDAVTLETTEVISDSSLLIEFVKSSKSTPKVSAIEINLVAPHLAHAVANGPYQGVDTDGDGFAVVQVDGSASHTHGPGLSLVEWTWKAKNQVVGTGEIANLTLPVGENIVTLLVVDDGGNDSADSTTITVNPYGYPSVVSLSPDQGNIAGGDQITITGSGFDYSADQIKVYVGALALSGSDIVVVDSETITVQSPAEPLGTPVPIFVETPLGTSNTLFFTYVEGGAIEFKQGILTDMYTPTTLEFGPDEKLYVGTSNGFIFKLTLDDAFNVVESVSTSIIADNNLEGGNRTILGLTFDPMDVSSAPALYVSHSHTFHGEKKSSSGQAINGKISRISGANLDTIDDVITGLPVSDHDHAVNGITFGDNGELYIQIGGNTNAGVPGRLTSNQVQKDNALSAATLVAYLSDPSFNGSLTYDADDDGNLNAGYGVEVFAHGNRNPFDIVLHSNGYLYGTDNGPNLNYGDRSTGCASGEELPEIEEADKINLLTRGAYYGHANRKRGETDPRQCIWHSQTALSDENFTAPIVIAPSSANGIIEFQTDHFNGQLRGNLIYSKYKKSLHRVILTADGTGVLPQSVPPIELVGDGGLDVTQAPDGSLVEARYLTGHLYYYRPVEADTTAMIVKGVFPRRGGLAGGSSLSIYGVNFPTTSSSSSSSSSSSLTVAIGGSDCPVQSAAATKIVCTLPGGSGTVDVTVSTTAGTASSTFQRGYRYISGTPAE